MSYTAFSRAKTRGDYAVPFPVLGLARLTRIKTHKQFQARIIEDARLEQLAKKTTSKFRHLDPGLSYHATPYDPCNPFSHCRYGEYDSSLPLHRQPQPREHVMPYSHIEPYGFLGQLVHDISESDTSFVMLTTRFRMDGMVYDICDTDDDDDNGYCPAVLRSSDGRCENVKITETMTKLHELFTHGGTQRLNRVTVTRSSQGGRAFVTGATLTATCRSPEPPREHTVTSCFVHPETGDIVKRELANSRLVYARTGMCATQWFK